MSANGIEQQFIESVANNYRLIPDGNDRFLVSTSFFFDDGDEYTIALKRDNDKWMLSDEGHTYMYLSYRIDDDKIHRGKRGEVIQKVLTMFDIEDRDGELMLDLSDGYYGEALNDFIQSIQKISNVLYWKRYGVRTTFKSVFSEMLYGIVDKARIEYNWHEPELDPDKNYSVDYKINGMPKPLFVFTLSSDAKTRKATIILHQFKKWDVDSYSIGVLKNDLIDKEVRIHLEDICDYCPIGMPASIEAIRKYAYNFHDPTLTHSQKTLRT